MGSFLGMVFPNFSGFPQFLFPLHGVLRWVEVRQMISDDLLIRRISLFVDVFDGSILMIILYTRHPAASSREKESFFIGWKQKNRSKNG